MIDDTITIQIKEKLKYYKDKKSELHVTLLNRTFYNGFIISISEYFFELNDKKLGTVPVFFKELSSFVPYMVEETK